jgi:hypothetical protein
LNGATRDCPARAHVIDEHATNAIGVFKKLGIAPRHFRRSHAGSLTKPAFYRAIKQFDSGVTASRIPQSRQRIAVDGRPQLSRRETLTGKIILTGAGSKAIGGCDGTAPVILALP